MQHARQDYTDRIQDAAHLIPDDEPVFLLRGQDFAGAPAVRAWAYLHVMHGGSKVEYKLAMRHAGRMKAWAAKHGKSADLPTPEEMANSRPAPLSDDALERIITDELNRARVGYLVRTGDVAFVLARRVARRMRDQFRLTAAAGPVSDTGSGQ
jgi:hypothetical protein